MRTRYWLIGGILLSTLFIWTAQGGGQPGNETKKADTRSPEPSPTIAPPGRDDTPPVPSPSVPSLTPPAPPTMDQLIDRLMDIRARKAALEKEEQATIAAIQEKMRMQRERLNQLGVGDPPLSEKK
jgi:hypothetical protein